MLRFFRLLCARLELRLLENELIDVTADLREITDREQRAELRDFWYALQYDRVLLIQHIQRLKDRSAEV